MENNYVLWRKYVLYKFVYSLILLALMLTTSCRITSNNNIDTVLSENSIDKNSDDEEAQNAPVTDNKESSVSIAENMIKAENYVEQEVPELDAYDTHITEKSNGKAYLIVECDGRAEDVNDIVVNDELSGKYYSVYVGEQWKDHKVNWDWFFVSEDFDEILWYYLPESEVYTLFQWRDSNQYELRQSSFQAD